MTAKEMFEELCYKEVENDIHFLKYSKTCMLHHDKEIKFHKPDKTFTVKDDNGVNHRWISLQELRAINKQCKELGWFDE